ncbi:MAG: hypothetical protein P8K78_01745, partial [Pirellulales bacterium]|nr:hypothetical protein [Pirellulales bacterium]
WIGRIFTCGVLALGWVRLARAVAPKPGMAVISAVTMLGLSSFFQLSGEWVVGGFEGKGLAYGFIFLALADLAKNRWNRAWILLGIASIWHVVVGGWACVAATIGWFLLGSRSDRPTLRSQIGAIVLGFFISLLGLLPGIQLGGEATREQLGQAAAIQVFSRLPHHLDPQHFLISTSFPYLTPAAIRFLLLVGLWVLLATRLKANAAAHRFNLFTAGTLAIAMIGLLISLTTRADPLLSARLLQFYWFRLADVMVPAACGLSLVCYLTATGALRHRVLRTGVLLGTLIILCVPLSAHHRAAGIPPADRKFTRYPASYQDWRAACHQARRLTPSDALFLTPKYNHTFKWYAGRGEVATWKEMPQDAPSVLEWNDRLARLYPNGPYGAVPLAARSATAIRNLGNRYGAGYVLTLANPHLALPLLYHNESFAIYRIVPSLPAEQRDAPSLP